MEGRGTGDREGGWWAEDIDGRRCGRKRGIEMVKEHFSSRWGFVLTAMGAAVGTGNIWRFPREAALYGGGSFLVAWLIFLFLWSIPMLMAEFAIGKTTRLGTIGSFRSFVGKKYTWMGAWMVWVSTAINFYYAVVMGWTIRYFWVSLNGEITLGDTAALWKGFINSPLEVVFFQVLALIFGGYVVYRGVAKGIEKANTILLPSLIILLTVAAIWALTLPGSIDGLRFMFVPRPSYFASPEMWIHAAAQSAWSCSAGMGMAITYAVYVRKKEDIGLNAFITGLGNNSVSLISGIAVLGTVFALSPTITAAFEGINAGSSGLTFIYLTRLFGQMPMGRFIAVIFFLAMSFAALTSLISGFEIATRNFMDHGWSRKRAVSTILLATFAMGLPSAMSIRFLNNQDAVWGLGLLVSGLFVSFAVIKYGAREFRERLINTEYSDIQIGRWWDIIMTYLIPLEFAVMAGWFLMEEWHSSPASFWSIVLQWSLAMAALVYLNRWLAREVKSVDEETDVADLKAGG
ncbi:MAG: sodium-dependent transporter [Thermoplasmata archaeon]|nr:sodium-dependent transporter [Thermoplasmata archaeon]